MAKREEKSGPMETGLDARGNFISGLTPFPKDGKFPVIPQQNYWDGGNFMVPGMGPLMSTSILDRFPQLAGLFGGKTPENAATSFAPPAGYGTPPSGGSVAITQGSTPKKDGFDRLRSFVGRG